MMDGKGVVGCGKEERRPVSLVKLQFVSSIYKFIAVIRSRHEVFNCAVIPVSHKVHDVCGLNSCRVVVERVKGEQICGHDSDASSEMAFV
jgi:hypothetical protein